MIPIGSGRRRAGASSRSGPHPFAGYASERFELPRGANLMRLRFSPNDLGRANFRAERLVAEQDTLTLNFLGQPIRYRRLSAEEMAQQQAAPDDLPMDTGTGEGPPALSRKTRRTTGLASTKG